MEIKPLGTVYYLANILRGGIGGDHGRYGDKVPGIFFRAKTTTLHVCSAVSANVNLCYDSKTPLPMNKFTKVVVEQRMEQDKKLHYVISIADKEVFNLVNTRPQIFYDVRYTASDPWHVAAKAQIQNFEMTMQKDCLGKQYILQSSSESL